MFWYSWYNCDINYSSFVNNMNSQNTSGESGPVQTAPAAPDAALQENTTAPVADATVATDSASVGVTVARELTYGEQAVGLTFNPSGDEKVQQVKELYAKIIDILATEPLDNSVTSLKGRILGRAVNEAIGAQMWAVKAVTYKY